MNYCILFHIIFPGARKIRVGMDLKQYLFYVTAHRYVATPLPVQDCCNDPFYSDKCCHYILIHPDCPDYGNGASRSFFLFIQQCVQEILHS